MTFSEKIKQLQELIQIRELATRGLWGSEYAVDSKDPDYMYQARVFSKPQLDEVEICRMHYDGYIKNPNYSNDLSFIQKAGNVFAQLCRDQIVLIEALEFYKNRDNWQSVTDGYKQYLFMTNKEKDAEYRPDSELMIQTGGKVAREALKKVCGDK